MELKYILQERFRFQVDFFQRMIKNLERERQQLMRDFHELGSKPDPDELYFLEEEAAGANAFMKRCLSPFGA